jgi:NAD(P)H-hydrate epimerase
MCVMAALRSGVGLLTAFVPDSLVPAFAARAPEAMWVGWPETQSGGLGLAGERLLRERMERGTALVMGPGMGREEETLALMASVVKFAPMPTVLDADCLRPEIVKAAGAPLVLTPHAGEFARIAGGMDLRTFAADSGAAIVKKGPMTAVAMRAGADEPDSDKMPVFHSFYGGPVLSRGGSGDILSGMVGSQLAQTPSDRLLAACRGVIWHGRAADVLARTRGQTAVTTTELLDFLPAALRSSL